MPIILLLDAAYIKARYQVDYNNDGVDLKLILHITQKMQAVAVGIIEERLLVDVELEKSNEIPGTKFAV